MTRVAIVGAGAMGRIHAQAYAGIADAVVTAVVDHLPEAAGALAASTGARPYTDLEAMLQQEQVDVVDCCLPTSQHRDTVLRVAAAGHHVICEKPLARTIEEGVSMIAACRSAGVQMLIAQVVRFFPEYRKLAEALQAGRIGTLVSASVSRQGRYPEGWYRDDSQSGGVLLDLMIHDFDWVLRQSGPAERVYARLVRHEGAQPFTQGMATVTHRSGVLTQLTGTWGYPGPLTTGVELVGTGGLLRYNSGESKPIQLLASVPLLETGGIPLPDLSIGEDPYHTELAHFIAVLQGNSEPLVHPEEALEALALALTARDAAEQGRAQQVAEVIV